jgi:stage II sporulation protein D
MMRARRVAAAVALVLAACRPAGPPVAPGVGLPRTEPTVRVGIAVDTPRVAVGAGTSYEILDARGEVVVSARAEDVWSFTADGRGRLTGRNQAGRSVGPLEPPVRVRARGAGPVTIAGRPYRGGAVLLSNRPGRVTAVNIVELEEYLLGVVPSEIGRRPAEELEAIKAQAVAARTYAIANLGGRESLGFDYYATTADQVYGGIAAEDSVVSRAVEGTRGEILTYAGRPILAYFHSTCGGRTADISEVWPWRAPQPYLRSVSDRIPGTDRHYCDASNRFRWTTTWTGEQLARILATTLMNRAGEGASRVRRVERVELDGKTGSGRAKAVRIVADGQTYRVRADSIRWVLRPEPGRILNSSLLLSLEQKRTGGEVRQLVARGGGWGHGVGMCQWGAIGRARAGQNYREILSAYYRDTRISRLY